MNTKNTKKKAKKKKKSAVAKPAPATLIGYTIVNECICGEKVELYDRQEMFFDHNKQQWFRLCEDCIDKNAKSKKQCAIGPVGPVSPIYPTSGPQPAQAPPPQPPSAIRKILEIGL